MFNLSDIKLQNQQDAWTLLFFHFCEEITRAFGEKGEMVIRGAVKAMGFYLGKRSMEELAAAGINTNLHSLFEYGACSACDPRAVFGPIREKEGQMRLWDVFVCPIAAFLNKRGASRYALYYCEEYLRAVVLSYTEGCGQLNLSKKLSCPRDVHCQFSAYLRPANLPQPQRERSFGAAASAPGYSKARFSDVISDKTILLCCAMYEKLLEFFPEDGEYVFSRALRSYLPEVLGVMKKHASDTQMPCTGEFLKLSFPISTDTSADELWKKANGKRAAELVQKLLLDSLKIAFCANSRA